MTREEVIANIERQTAIALRQFEAAKADEDGTKYTRETTANAELNYLRYLQAVDVTFRTRDLEDAKLAADRSLAQHLAAFDAHALRMEDLFAGSIAAQNKQAEAMLAIAAAIRDSK